ncbi:hypothetical protein FPOAC2_04153 [Fusarium poae]|uniref:hypothetical protein n=1 Tax=Fusarium poae TaxID=36050 RepID=UPI001CEA6252|nr:hypothetical protein FPOAC1_004084 [Fusarium poae]KAG8670850.1 hypothetical protein FPOAC1_004084 [Fusarium poae]
MPTYQNLKRLRCIPSRSKPSSHIEINIDGHHDSKIYTTGSTVQGSVRLISQKQTAFQSIQISLRGTTSTRQSSQYGQPFTTHTFLNIQMPISEDVLPAGHVLQDGEFSVVPFLFKIPEDLALNACNHRNPVVRERHLLPPPSLGSWVKNDFTDGSTYVDYVIRARLVLEKNSRGEEKFVDQNISLKVLPIFPEQPPIHINSLNSQYCLSQTKTIRRNLVGAKEGTLKISTTQPRPISLHLDHLQTSDSQLVIDLEYVPSSPRGTPPDMRVKGAVIETITSFWTGPIGFLPDHDEVLPSVISPVAPWTNSYPLLLRGVEEVTWKKVGNFNPSAESERRASEPIQVVSARVEPAYKAPSSIDIDYNQPEPLTYKATMTQPFNLPTEKLLFIPTFHSCMVSRSYRIRIILATKAHGSTVSLIVPLQITSEGLVTTCSPRLPVYYDDSESEQTCDSPPPYSRQ